MRVGDAVMAAIIVYDNRSMGAKDCKNLGDLVGSTILPLGNNEPESLGVAGLGGEGILVLKGEEILRVAEEEEEESDDDDNSDVVLIVAVAVVATVVFCGEAELIVAAFLIEDEDRFRLLEGLE